MQRGKEELSQKGETRTVIEGAEKKGGSGELTRRTTKNSRKY